MTLKYSFSDIKAMPFCILFHVEQHEKGCISTLPEYLYNCILYNANPNGRIGKFRWQYIRELAYRYEKGLIED